MRGKFLVLVICAFGVCPFDANSNSTAYSVTRSISSSTECQHSLRNIFSNSSAKWPIAFLKEKQKTAKSCSLATVTMILNSLTGRSLPQAEVLEKSNFSTIWATAISPQGDGIILNKMGLVLADLLGSIGFGHYTVEVIHMNPSFALSRERAMRAITSVSKDGGKNQILLANFLQSRLAGQTDGASGHYSPIGGYDFNTHSLYLSEPDGGAQRPAWNALENFLSATETFDETAGNYRGFIWIYKK